MPDTKKKIIIFDDDEDILLICTYLLVEKGWEVKTYTSCDDHLNKIASFKPSVILMDNWIPPEGGIAATQVLKLSAALKHIPVIYFSANSDIEALSHKAGAEAWIAKPFEIDHLIEIINNVSGKTNQL